MVSVIFVCLAWLECPESIPVEQQFATSAVTLSYVGDIRLKGPEPVISVSPNGRYIVRLGFERSPRSSGYALRLIDLSGSLEQDLILFEESPPSLLAWNAGGSKAIVSAGSRTVLLTLTTGNYVLMDLPVSWSHAQFFPNEGRLLGIRSANGAYVAEIYDLATNSTTPLRSVNTSLKSAGGEFWMIPQGQNTISLIGSQLSVSDSGETRVLPMFDVSGMYDIVLGPLTTGAALHIQQAYSAKGENLTFTVDRTSIHILEPSGATKNVNWNPVMRVTAAWIVGNGFWATIQDDQDHRSYILRMYKIGG
jgi:hypothetical protein